MKHIRSTYRALCAACLLALLVALLGSHGLARAGAPSTAPAATYHVYLPLAVSPGTPSTSPAVRVTYDPSRRATAAIGPEGGTLRATAADGTRFELVVPPDALDFTETITMTPALRAENLPLSGGLIGAVNLEPDGLIFYQPVTLRIIPTALAPGFKTIGFAYNGTGEQFHLRPVVRSAGSMQIQAEQELELDIPWPGIVTLRPVGAGQGSQADIDRQQSQPAPADPQDALEQQLAVENGLQASFLSVYYHSSVLPKLERAKTDDRLADQAITDYDQWVARVGVLGLRSRFVAEFFQSEVMLQTILQHASIGAAERCYTQKRPEEGFRLLRWLRYARKYLVGADSAAIEAKLAKCLKFELTFHSVITESAPGYGYYYELRAKTTLQAAASTRATGSAPLEWVDFHWSAGGPCQFSVSNKGSTFDAASGRLGLSMTPISRTSPAVNLTLRYDPGVPTEHTSMLCPGGGGFSWDSTAWKDYFTQTHESERESTGFRATIQVVNAGSFTGWIYNQTTSGPSGQSVVEDTQIDIAHVPER